MSWSDGRYMLGEFSLKGYDLMETYYVVARFSVNGILVYCSR